MNRHESLFEQNLTCIFLSVRHNVNDTFQFETPCSKSTSECKDCAARFTSKATDFENYEVRLKGGDFIFCGIWTFNAVVVI